VACSMRCIFLIIETFLQKTKERNNPRRSAYRHEDNIKIIIQLIIWECVDYIIRLTVGTSSMHL
jgi:hypothetical protein